MALERTCIYCGFYIQWVVEVIDHVRRCEGVEEGEYWKKQDEVVISGLG
jgi:hypothetical protein